MKRILFALPLVAALGGCAQLDSLGITPGAVLGAARAIDCYISNNATNRMVQTDTAIACQLLGGTPMPAVH